MKMQSQLAATHYYWVLQSMGWLQLVGSLKLEVSFAKEPNKRDDILQKRPIICILQKRRVILRSLLIVATPYYYRVVLLGSNQKDL